MTIKITSFCLLILLLAIPVFSQEKQTIAVAEFEGQNVSAMDAVVISNLLRMEIVKTEKFNVVDRNNMEQILSEQAFQTTGCTDQECAVKMGKLLNVNKIIVGSVMKLGKIYLINANMIDVKTGKIEKSEKGEAVALEELATTTEYLAGVLAGTKIDRGSKRFQKAGLKDREDKKFKSKSNKYLINGIGWAVCCGVSVYSAISFNGLAGEWDTDADDWEELAEDWKAMGVTYYNDVTHYKNDYEDCLDEASYSRGEADSCETYSLLSIGLAVVSGAVAVVYFVKYDSLQEQAGMVEIKKKDRNWQVGWNFPTIKLSKFHLQTKFVSIVF